MKFQNQLLPLALMLIKFLWKTCFALQAELCILNLASTTIVIEGKKIVVRCALTGPTPSVSLSNMRALQNYSPARVAEVRVVMHDGSANLVLDVCDCTAKMTTTELEIVRITKRRRML
jgi:hypothetical protein